MARSTTAMSISVPAGSVGAGRLCPRRRSRRRASTPSSCHVAATCSTCAARRGSPTTEGLIGGSSTAASMSGALSERRGARFRRCGSLKRRVRLTSRRGTAGLKGDATVAVGRHRRRRVGLSRVRQSPFSGRLIAACGARVSIRRHCRRGPGDRTVAPVMVNPATGNPVRVARPMARRASVVSAGRAPMLQRRRRRPARRCHRCRLCRLGARRARQRQRRHQSSHRRQRAHRLSLHRRPVNVLAGTDPGVTGLAVTVRGVMDLVAIARPPPVRRPRHLLQARLQHRRCRPR